MTWTLVYIISAVLAGLSLTFVQWWSMRRELNSCGFPKSESERAKDALTLKDLIIAILVTICPFINSLVAIGVMLYIFSEIAPKIVLFGGK